ncbi:chemotaxis protein CheY [Pseudomonas orientalis]|uniref:chemotaxis protein CheY n=1 Tax=Pseudomonas orientalis TaxID=76758 RepID=UPI001FB010A1|nr:chemotaxis protein CheY [Pseudomonas orientalis]UOB22296.1 chemotaxis protein CheY [Pseudomonas orientalis]
MSNKTLRFLIAEGEHLQRIKIEKMLNQLGYYRIAPLSSFDEVQALTRSNGVTFDLLIINTALMRGHPIDLLKYCRENLMIRHALIYDGECAQRSVMPVSASQTLHLSLSQSPDFNALCRCLEALDPAAMARVAGMSPTR